MCLLGIAFRQFDEMPLVILANREEFYARPTAGPKLFPREGDKPAWMGGIDLLAGGTWLGINEFGLLVAVTNRRKQSPPENPPSRGLLCRSLLAFRDTASAVEAALRELDGNQYAGCNFLIGSRESAAVIEVGDVLTTTSLDPGLHLLANAALNDSADRRILRVRKEFERAGAIGIEDWFREALRVCPLAADGDEPPICLKGRDRGTVSSTVLGLGQNPADSRYWYAPGPPDTTPYEDFTSQFRAMLTSRAGQAVPDIEPPYDSPARRAVRHSLTYGLKARDASSPAAATPSGAEGAAPAPESNSPYRILLRGPWQSEPLARAERDASGNLVWSVTALPEPATVRLPASWQDLFGPFRGRIRFRRRFHPPSSIEPTDRLFIVFDSVGGFGSISLNGQPLGKIETPTGISKLEVTGLLQVNNELAIELEFTDFDSGAPSAGLHAPVALEIHGV
jgi:uncharacterized protein with NRDE domain